MNRTHHNRSVEVEHSYTEWVTCTVWVWFEFLAVGILLPHPRVAFPVSIATKHQSPTTPPYGTEPLSPHTIILRKLYHVAVKSLVKLLQAPVVARFVTETWKISSLRWWRIVSTFMQVSLNLSNPIFMHIRYYSYKSVPYSLLTSHYSSHTLNTLCTPQKT